MLDVVRGATDAPVSVELLISGLQNINFSKAIFYSGYPILSASSKTSIDGLLISQDHGVIIFDIVEGDQPELRQNVRDEIYNLVYSKFISNQNLAARRGVLILPVNVVTFAPAYPKAYNDTEELIKDQDELSAYLASIIGNAADDTNFRKVLEVIQAVTKLKHKPARQITNTNSKGDKLNKLEKSISNLDKQQSKAVIETTTGIQRIRGLAGSGKTIVLALKVAYLHSKYPDWEIGVTFYTRSLKDQFKELITKFTIEQKGDEPDWNKIKIIQAWGGSSEIGIYYQYCLQSNVEYLDYDNAKRRFGSRPDLLDILAKKALAETRKVSEIYDIICVDEAQDFSESFLLLCYSLLKSHDPVNASNKRLIYAYDELQNLSKTSLRNPVEIFGDSIDFKNEPNKPKQDIILEKCYRNSAYLLITAHGLGFGIYREEGPVTMFKEKDIWLDVGYFVEDGMLDFGQKVKLFRSNETSPEYYKGIDKVDELIKFQKFDSTEKQYDFIVEEIYKNITEDDLNPKDIIVIHPDAFTAKNEVAIIRKKLFQKNIQSHLAGVTTSPDNFFIENSVAFTSIFRAKGNEAAMVYIVNADYCFGGYSLITKRNILFTAITRSKCWVRVCGVGRDMSGVMNEFEQIRKNRFRLDFIYPTLEEMDKLNVIHRDVSIEEERKIKESNAEISNLVKKLGEGEIKKEDLTKDQLDLLRDLLNAN